MRTFRPHWIPEKLAQHSGRRWNIISFSLFTRIWLPAASINGTWWSLECCLTQLFLAHGCSEPTFCCFLLVFHPKVRRFYLRQQKRREVLEWRDQERLAALRSIMDKQARRDRERWVSDSWTAKHANGLYLFICYCFLPDYHTFNTYYWFIVNLIIKISLEWFYFINLLLSFLLLLLIYWQHLNCLDMQTLICCLCMIWLCP